MLNKENRRVFVFEIRGASLVYPEVSTSQTGSQATSKSLSRKSKCLSHSGYIILRAKKTTSIAELEDVAVLEKERFSEE